MARSWGGVLDFSSLIGYQEGDLLRVWCKMGALFVTVPGYQFEAFRYTVVVPAVAHTRTRETLLSISSNKLKEPSILLAGSNCQRLIRNIQHVLDPAAVSALQQEVHDNVKQLFELGTHHFLFAKSIPNTNWRQRVSRFYYAAYNIRRAITLDHSGHFAMDVTDHKKIGDLPDDFPNQNMFATELEGLRDDRNLADYNHVANDADLLKIPADVETLVTQFRTEALKYLTTRGINL